MLGMPSLDCVVGRGRSSYSGSLVRHTPSILSALLAQTLNSVPVAWVSLIRGDSDRLVSLGVVPSGMGAFCDASEVWQALLSD